MEETAVAAGVLVGERAAAVGFMQASGAALRQPANPRTATATLRVKTGKDRAGKQIKFTGLWYQALESVSRSNSTGEDAANDLFDGDFLDVDIADREFVQQSFADRDDTVAFDLDLNVAGVLGDDFAIPA